MFVFMIVMSMLVFAAIHIERNSFYAKKNGEEENNVQRDERLLALMLRQLRDGIDKNNDLMRHYGMQNQQDTRDEQVEDTGNIVTGNRVSDVAVVASATDLPPLKQILVNITRLPLHELLETISNPPVHEKGHLVDDIPYMIDPFYQPSVSALLLFHDQVL